MATPRKGLGRVLVTLLLVVGFVIGPVVARHAAAWSGACHDAVGDRISPTAAAGHAHGSHGVHPTNLPDERPDGFDRPRVPTGFACLVHCSLPPIAAGLAIPAGPRVVAEPPGPAAEPVSREVEPAVPPPRFERIDAI